MMLGGLKAPKLPFRELDVLVKAIGECRSKAEEDRIIAAEVDTLKARLADPRLDKSRGREYMVRVIYCEMLGHDASFALIPALQLASDPNLLTKKAAYLALTQLLDYKHELVLLLVNTLLVDLKSDNWVVVGSALVAAAKLIGPDLINAVLPLVVERLGHGREGVRKKAVMALTHFAAMDPARTGPLAGVEVERHFRAALCDKEPSVMAAALNGLAALAATNPAPFRGLVPSLASILKQVVEHRLPKAYDYHRFPAPFIQIKLLKLLRLLGAGDKPASDGMAAVVGAALRRAAAGGSHTIGHAIVYEAVRTITEMHPHPQLLAAAAEAVSGLLRAPSHNLKYCGLTALAAITRVSPGYAAAQQVAVLDCLGDPDDSLKLQALQLLVTMTRPNNVQVVVERLMDFLRSSACGGDDTLRRHIAGQVAELAEKYAPDTAWFVGVMAEVFEAGGDALPPALAHNLCRLIAEADGELHAAAVARFLAVLDRGTAAPAHPPGGGGGGAGGGPLPEVLLRVIAWVLGEYGTLAPGLPPAAVMDKLCAAVGAAKASPTTRGYLLTSLTKLAAASGGRLPPEADELMTKAGASAAVELQQRAHEARALLGLPPALRGSLLPFDGSCEELEPHELDEARHLTFLEGFVAQALADGAAPYAPPPELAGGHGDDDLEGLGLPRSGSPPAARGHALRFDAYEPAAAPAAAGGAAAPGAGGGGGGFGGGGAAPAPAAAAAAAAGGGFQQQAPPQLQPQQQAQPQLPQLKGANRGRWGPAEFGSGGGGGGSSSSSAAAAAPAAAPPAAAPPRPGTGGAGGGKGQGLSPEKSRLAASLFGTGDASPSSGGGGGGRFGVRGGGARAPPSPPPPAAPLVDLLGDDVAAAGPAVPSGAGGSAGGASGLDLLMDLDGPPPAAAAAAAAAPAPPAAAPLDDLLGGLAAPAPAAPAAASGGGGGGLMDLDGLLGGGGGVPAAAPPPPLLGGAPGLQGLTVPAPAAAAQPPPPGAALRGGPAKGSTVTDPFGDLLG
ncbi:AP-4 complex subunit epsilon [Scenedesmus sp. PABB004]|nr:AP-4 complex subunit epsilon [Scenedesmus sp. PABB004]